MRLAELELPGVYLLESQAHSDERGEFVRVWSAEALESCGLRMQVSHVSVARNPVMGTLRGLHYQIAPHSECKIVRCLSGTLFDVVLDLRVESPTYLRHLTIELSHVRDSALWIPQGCAHGYQTLEDNTSVEYFIDNEYRPEHARGVRFDDPALNARWPVPVTRISERDRNYPPLRASTAALENKSCATPS